MKKILIYEIPVDDEVQEQLMIAEIESVIGMRPARIEEVEE